MTDRGTRVLIGEVVGWTAGRPAVGIAGGDIETVQVDARSVQVGGHFHPFLQRSEQVGNRVAPGLAAELLQRRLQRLLARLLGNETRPFEELRRPLCSGTVEIAPRLPEPVAASLCHGPSYALRPPPPTETTLRTPAPKPATYFNEAGSALRAVATASPAATSRIRPGI